MNALQLYVHILAGTVQHGEAQEHFVGLVEVGLAEQLEAILELYSTVWSACKLLLTRSLCFPTLFLPHRPWSSSC